MDRRVQRTRAAITTALYDLIGERRWDKISVQDLLDRTGISRSTFYAHYDNKLDVLTSAAPAVVTRLIDPTTGRADLGDLFEHVAGMADVFGPLLSQPVLGDITAAFERALAADLADTIDERVSPQLCTFVAGALMSTLRAYLAQRRRPAPDIAAREIEHYIDALLATAPARTDAS